MTIVLLSRQLPVGGSCLRQGRGFLPLYPRYHRPHLPKVLVQAGVVVPALRCFQPAM